MYRSKDFEIRRSLPMLLIATSVLDLHQQSGGGAPEQKQEDPPPLQPSSTTPIPVGAAVAEKVKIAEQVATVAAVTSETVAPGINQAPIDPGSAEASVLSIEESARRVMQIIPGAAMVSGFMLPAEVVTHLVFSFVHLFQHHVKTTQAQGK